MNPLAEIFRYNRWANEVVLGACRELSDTQLDAPMAGADRTSIRRKLLHIVGGQQTFVLRTMGRQHEGELNGQSAWPGFDVLDAIARETSDKLIAIAEALEADTVVTLPYMGRTPRFPLSFFLAHAAEHGSEHRTQIAAALSDLGLASPNLDGWAYAEAAGYGGE